MRKVFIGGIVVAMAVYAIRRLGSGLGARAMRECETMFETMPEDFPPKRMMRGIDEIREQNIRILRELEKLEKEEHPGTALAAG